jgi:hypothetical protein
MMKKLLLLTTLLISGSAFAQQAYFQQDVAYTIQVRLDDVKHELHGFETLIYKNNSNDALPFIYMHLWPNAYRDNNTALGKQLTEEGDLFFYYAKPEDRGYIDSLDFKVDGQSAKLEYDPQNPDIAKLILPVPIQPGGQITITTPFHVKIPSGKISRLGHIGQQYQITQWYPKPAVYDRNGWNQMPYLNQGEFYSEFGTFDVFITLPKNYVLGSTGDLLDNPEEKKFMDDLAAATKEKSSFDKKDDSFPASSTEMKTLHYHQVNVHDFAWFCDKRYHVLKGEVELPHTKRKVTTWVMFTNQYAHLWKNSIPYINDALYYYSKWNGDYTYDVCTAVDGALSAGGGMEYPNITVIGGINTARTLDIVITHEVGHNWFYGMLGSNERRYPWLDEGVNSSNELRYVATKYPQGKLMESPAAAMLDVDQYPHRAQYYQLYAFSARQRLDQPDNLPAAEYTSLNYGGIIYMKTAVIFNYLRVYLGDSIYDKAFQTYFDRWHWKHPMPEDLEKTFEEVSGKNLDWAFVDLITTTKRLDYKIVSAKHEDGHSAYAGSYRVTIRNTGEINAPVMVSGVKNGKIVSSVWAEGFSGETTVTLPDGDYDEIVIDQDEWMPEINRKNNRSDVNGILKKAEPLRLQFGGSLDNPARTQLFWTPALGWNNYDKFMLGAAFYNHVLPGKTFEWTLMPMYSFGAQSLVGHADAFFNFRPKSVFQLISVGVNANRYHYYTLQPGDYAFLPETQPDRDLGFIKVAPELNFELKNKRARSPIKHTIQLRYIWTSTTEPIFTGDSASQRYEIKNIDRAFYEASYKFANSRSISPYDFTVTLQQGDDMMKAQVEANYHLTFMRNKNIDIRLFAGIMGGDNTGPYRFRMSGWGPLGIGNHDYLYDHIFLGRSEDSGFLAQQMVVADGGFKIYSPVGQSSSGLAALNITVPMPVKNKLLSHIKVYGDFGMYGTPGGSEFVYNAGVQVMLIRNICDVFFPVVYSKSIKDYYDANELGYGNMIRFTLYIERLNPLSFIRRIKF